MLLIDAQIRELNEAAFYPVKLSTVPRPGEVIRLWSRIDAEADHEADHSYTVQKIEHRVHDAPEGMEERATHTVVIHVKRNCPVEHVGRGHNKHPRRAWHCSK